jgi:hypothetical protein
MWRRSVQIFLKFGRGLVEGRAAPSKAVTSSMVIVISIFKVDCHVVHVKQWEDEASQGELRG